ncbi:hypothetical protein Scep_026561 [Stephania cephalantha]|uniref:Uncharacterized protein n=1 Tax=Stephania cephalantha TaxID=152367 RepID=A0AAP0ENJ1_9MAGN
MFVQGDVIDGNEKASTVEFFITQIQDFDIVNDLIPIEPSQIKKKCSKRNQINQRKKVTLLPHTGSKPFKELMDEMVNMSIVILPMLEEFNWSLATVVI